MRSGADSSDIAVVIPAYRAASTIADVIRSVPAVARWIVVVDDGSDDDVASAARSTSDERVVVVSHERNRGVGAAVLTGYEHALALGAALIVKLDADGQMDASRLAELVAPIEEGRADYAKGNRFLHAQELRAMPTRRRYGNVGLSFLTKLATGYWPIFDPTNGYTVIHASVARLLDRSKIAERYFFETSMLIELSRLRAVVTDVYMPARYAGEQSSLRPMGAALGFPWPLFRAFLARVRREYFIRDFSAVSLYIVAGTVLLMFGTLWGAWFWAASIRTGVPATTGTVMIAVLPLILGVQLLLQAATLDIQGAPAKVIQTRPR